MGVLDKLLRVGEGRKIRALASLVPDISALEPELLQSRLAALELVMVTLDRSVTKRGRAEVELAPEEVEAWLGVVNDARLTLGTRLGVTEDAESEAIDPSAPEAPAHAVYGWLTWFENDLLETLLG